MITKTEATQIKQSTRQTAYWGEMFEQAVIRLDKEIRRSATHSTDGISTVFNPRHVPALLVILKEYGFDDAAVDPKENFRININW